MHRKHLPDIKGFLIVSFFIISLFLMIIYLYVNLLKIENRQAENENAYLINHLSNLHQQLSDKEKKEPHPNMQTEIQEIIAPLDTPGANQMIRDHHIHGDKQMANKTSVPETKHSTAQQNQVLSFNKQSITETPQSLQQNNPIESRDLSQLMNQFLKNKSDRKIQEKTNSSEAYRFQMMEHLNRGLYHLESSGLEN